MAGWGDSHWGEFPWGSGDEPGEIPGSPDPQAHPGRRRRPNVRRIPVALRQPRMNMKPIRVHQRSGPKRYRRPKF